MACAAPFFSIDLLGFLHDTWKLKPVFVLLSILWQRVWQSVPNLQLKRAMHQMNNGVILNEAHKDMSSELRKRG